jgi:hypothetical protein
MTTRKLHSTWGYKLEQSAIFDAMGTREPNPRSPAFALQAIFKVAKEAGALDQSWDIRMSNSDIIDAAVHDKVTWNKAKSCWHIGMGTNVPFKKIVECVVRWYVRDWDFARHTRDAEIVYPEDKTLTKLACAGLANTSMPRTDELTRRIVTKAGCEKFYYLDVLHLGNDMFVAEHGRFDESASHQRVGSPADFWNLEAKTIFPFLKNLKVLSYTVHHISSKKGGVK